MKRYINLAFMYLILAMIGGVFYREYTKFVGYEGKTSLAVVHPHLLLMGTLFLLLVVVLCRLFPLEQQKWFGRFFILHNIALPFMSVMFVVRGVVQTMAQPLAPGVDSAISGVAGLSHILMLLSLTFFFLALKRVAATSTTL